MRAWLWLGAIWAAGCAPAAMGDDVSGADGGNPMVDAAFNGCATASYQAAQVPAALMVVLDRSSSMSAGGKWTSAASAITQALDQDAFNSLYVGLYAAPSGSVGVQCLLGLPASCKAPTSPQVALDVAGTMKSGDAGGVRRAIKNWLTANSPDTGLGDASPLHAVLDSAIATLKAWPVDGKRMILVVTDGTISCNSLTTRPGYPDCNGCTNDWEDPGNIVTLLAGVRQDAQSPIETFIVGVPGADTFDARGCNYPPYHMRLALSAMASAGSTHVPAACDGRTFTQSGADPTTSCHFDMTRGNFGVQQLADAIGFARSTVSCVLALPTPPMGGQLDRSRVNVEVVAGGATTQVPRRSDQANTCLTTGCWDYTGDQKVELIGKACSDVQAAADAQVNIVTGCLTRVL